MPTVAITMDLSCCRCRSKIEKVLCSIQKCGKFVFDKVVYEKDKVLITGSFDAIELCCKLRCKAGCFVIKIDIVPPPPPPPPPPPKCCEKDPEKCCKKDPKKCCKKEDPKCCKDEEPKCKKKTKQCKDPEPVVVVPPNPIVDTKKPEPTICNNVIPFFTYPYPCPYPFEQPAPICPTPPHHPCCECHMCKPPCPKPPPVCPPPQPCPQPPCPPPPCPQPHPCPPPPICYPQPPCPRPPCPRPPCPCPPWTPCQCHCRRDYCCEGSGHDGGSCVLM